MKQLGLCAPYDTPCGRTIAKRIRQEGPIRFFEFMNEALYGEAGYYRTFPTRIGKRGDFVTGPSIGPLYGELIARMIERKAEALEGAPFWIVEAGAGTGWFARDVLNFWSGARPELLKQIRYVVIEPWDEIWSVQERTLGELREHVVRVRGPEALPYGFTGLFFSNELFDAFPVRWLIWDAVTQQWREQYVVLHEDRFVLMQGHPEQDVQELEPALHQWAELWRVADGAGRFGERKESGRYWNIEIAPGLRDWLKEVMRRMHQGWLITVDYGYAHALEHWLSHPAGTVRAFRNHRQVRDVLSYPGYQDLTADVNFQAIIEEGGVNGFELEAFMSLGRFLFNLVRTEHQAVFSDRSAVARKLVSLMHPSTFGTRFRVLILRKSVGAGVV